LGVKIYSTFDPETQHFDGANVSGALLEGRIAMLINNVETRSCLHQEFDDWH
jgi:hypothetical protein